ALNDIGTIADVEALPIAAKAEVGDTNAAADEIVGAIHKCLGLGEIALAGAGAPDLDVGPAAFAGAGGDVRSIGHAIELAGGDVNSAQKAGVISEEFVEDHIGAAAVEDADVWTSAGTGGGDDIRSRIVIGVGDRDADATAEITLVSKITLQLPTVGV